MLRNRASDSHNRHSADKQGTPQVTIRLAISLADGLRSLRSHPSPLAINDRLPKGSVIGFHELIAVFGREALRSHRHRLSREASMELSEQRVSRAQVSP